MKSNIVTIAIITLPLWVTACATISTKPTAQIIDQIDFGSYPENYKDIIRMYYEKVLIDFDSAKYKIGKPLKAYRIKTGEILGEFRSITWAGYCVYAEINAKNRLGGYTGWQSDSVCMRNGMVDSDISSHSWGTFYFVGYPSPSTAADESPMEEVK